MDKLTLKEKIILLLNNNREENTLSYRPQTLLYSIFNNTSDATIRATISSLTELGWVEKIEKSNQTYLMATKLGIKSLIPHILIDRSATSASSEYWDGNYHLCLFAVPERQRQKRGRIRELLLKHHFRLWDQGLWLCPVLDQALISRLDSEKLLGYLSFITASKIDFPHNSLNRNLQEGEVWPSGLWYLQKITDEYRRLGNAGKKLDDLTSFDVVRYRSLLDWEEETLLVIRKDPFFPNRFFKMADEREKTIDLYFRLSHKQLL